MTLPPETIFHRYFQEPLVRLRNGNSYFGKQDLSSLPGLIPETLGRLQAAFNEGLLRLHGMAADGVQPSFHFDYIDSNDNNAVAFHYEGISFIGVTMPLFQSLWDVCEKVGTSPDFAKRFGAETIEQRQTLQMELFSTLLGFVVGHEYGHHQLGHQVRINSESPFYSEVYPSTVAGSLEDQVKELKADGYSVEFGLNGLMLGERRDLTIGNLGGQISDEALLTLFMTGALAFLFRDRQPTFDPGTIEKLTHPPSAVRARFVMIHINRWCDKSYKSLLPSLTPALFQEVIGILRRGAWGKDELAWPDQDAFLLSPTGNEYDTKLIAIYDRKLKE